MIYLVYLERYTSVLHIGISTSPSTHPPYLGVFPEAGVPWEVGERTVEPKVGERERERDTGERYKK